MVFDYIYQSISPVICHDSTAVLGIGSHQPTRCKSLCSLPEWTIFPDTYVFSPNTTSISTLFGRFCPFRKLPLCGLLFAIASLAFLQTSTACKYLSLFSGEVGKESLSPYSSPAVYPSFGIPPNSDTCGAFLAVANISADIESWGGKVSKRLIKYHSPCLSTGSPSAFACLTVSGSSIL